VSLEIDAAKPIRAGEELDLTQLEPWLRTHVAELDANAKIDVDQFPSGHSNLTYRVRVGDKDYVLRRPPFGTKVKSAHDMGREFRVLSALNAVYRPAPRPIAYCEDTSVLGAPFYLMERIVGFILRKDPGPFAGQPELTRKLCESFIDNLATIHAVDYAAAGLGELGKPEGYVERQVSGWSKRYADAQTDEIPDIGKAAAWLAAHIPASPPPALIHNDYKYDNLVLDADEPTKIVGVLDWEMSTIGDPLMDLGTSLAYWVMDDDPPEFQAFRWGPTNLPGSLNRVQLAERYAARTGLDVSGLHFHYAFAMFKNAVVAQQIYYRYAKGLTKDARFAGFIHAVRVLAASALRAAERGRIQ
jgi:aminoglycoside phosphotransferase (APT) family kinase protein